MSLIAHLLVLLTVVDGLFSADPTSNPTAQLLTTVPRIDHDIADMAGSSKSALGTGGMKSKLKAARLATLAGESVIMANGTIPNVLGRIFAAEPVGTLFLPHGGSVPAWKRWLGYTARPKGRLVVDAGAHERLRVHATLEALRAISRIGVLEDGVGRDRDARPAARDRDPQGRVGGRLVPRAAQPIHRIPVLDESLELFEQGIGLSRFCHQKLEQIEKKIELLHRMNDLGIDTANVGLPGAGPFHLAHIEALAKEVARAKLRIGVNVACRTVVSDIEPVVALTQRVGIPIEVCAFIGSSTIRAYTEDWGVDRMLKATEDALSFAKKHDLPVMYVTEDTTRAHPDTIRRLYTAAIECGAQAICICDTVGHIAPWGVRSLVHHVRSVVAATGRTVRIDWHGHRDRGLGVINTITAMTSGVDRLHATALGVGERVGNCSMDQLLINLRLMGYIDTDLSRLREYVEVASAGTGVPIPVNYPVFGQDAFRTATGVHAAAVHEARHLHAAVREVVDERVVADVAVDDLGPPTLHGLDHVGPSVLAAVAQAAVERVPCGSAGHDHRGHSGTFQQGSATHRD